jgi:hypothetical protein
MTRPHLFASVLGLLAAGLCGCGGLFELRDQNIRAEHQLALLEGYESYHTLMSDADTDIVWFEYRLPQGRAVTGAAATIASRIGERDACYKVAESSADSSE